MKKLRINFTNCFGIKLLKHEFDFGKGNPGNKAYAIYAPNGLMKTSFTKTFERLGQGKDAEEERYNRPSISEAFVDDVRIASDAIYVLKSEIDLQEDAPAITNILVNPEHKARYDEIIFDLDKKKNRLINSLQKISDIPKKDVEKLMLADVGKGSLWECIENLADRIVDDEVSAFEYSVLFDLKANEILKNVDFLNNAKEFSTRYHELFTQAGSIYTKGVFNPTRAETAFGTLDKQGFFGGGHKVQFRGDEAAIDNVEISKRIEKIHESIDSDERLKAIRTNLAKNAQTQALSDLIEHLAPTQIDDLIQRLKPEKIMDFKRDLWALSLRKTDDSSIYVEAVKKTQNDIAAIEIEAAKAAPRWAAAVNLFNDRFVDMPFTLSVSNHTMAVLGKEQAKLKFTFKDGDDKVEWLRSEIKTLSQGEKRALYLLNFIFEVEARSTSSQDTLFVIDDIADSFDYKNKHAIVQYLEDLDSKPNLYQLILTHNFDFFRTVANNFVHRDRCLMANRSSSEIVLAKADGIKNYFIGVFKEKVSLDQ